MTFDVIPLLISLTFALVHLLSVPPATFCADVTPGGRSAYCPDQPALHRRKPAADARVWDREWPAAAADEKHAPPPIGGRRCDVAGGVVCVSLTSAFHQAAPGLEDKRASL